MPLRNSRFAAVILVITCLTAAMAGTPTAPSSAASGSRGDNDDPSGPVRPTVPAADRHTPGRVFLERADSLMANPRVPDAQILVGDVVFRRGDMMMYCDSAIFFSTAASDSMEAYGSIRMEQGDTLFLYGDWLEYSGSLALATVYADDGNTVRLINRDVTLTTTVVNYDMNIDLGYYNVGGTLTDPRNTLSSAEGEYSPSTKDANFYRHVRLEGITEAGDSVWVFSDTLSYNTDTRIATLTCPSRIISKDGEILTSNGIFNTATNHTSLFDRSIVKTSNGNTLCGDTLFYDRTAGRGEAFGNMVLTDSARQITLEGDYGFYNELTDSAYVTGRARALEHSRPDTLYLHSEVIRSFTVTSDSAGTDTTHLLVANPRVRFFRADLQGICDSMTFVETDSTLHMNIHPIVWSDNRQIFGNVIKVFMNDSTVERAHLPESGFMAEHIEGDYFNQLSGKEMLAYMEDGHLRRLDVNGSVQGIIMPMENDSTYNKVANVESSFLIAMFKANQLERARMWDATSGTVTPLYLARRSLFRLPKFAWYEVLRPTSPDDIFRYPPEMEQLMAAPGNTRHTSNASQQP